MTNTQMVFERHEKKYMLGRQEYERLAKRLEEYVRPDEYGQHTIASIYYDTASFEIIRRSIAKPVYKEKLRLRAYNTPNRDSTVYLELKKKYDGVVYKRRIALPLWEAEQYMALGTAPRSEDQIFREIDWFRTRYQPIPQVLLAYDRVALYGREDGGLRLTFDKNVRWRSCELDLSLGSYGDSLLAHGACLMEIKTGRALPVWLARILAEEGIYPKSFSKYGTCYRDYIVGRGMLRHAG